MRIIFIIFLATLFYCTGRAEVIVYPAPQQMDASAQYKISITQNGRTVESFVYVSDAQFEKNRSKNTAYCIFSFSGKIIITVTRLDTSFTTCQVLPSSYKIIPAKKNNSVSFVLDKPRNIAVEFDKSQKYPLLIFANPLEQDIPKVGEDEVIYYGPGYHDDKDTIRLRENQSLYLAGGAVLSAYVWGNDAAGAKVYGRGIISGRRFGHTHGKLLNFTGKSDDLYFEGFTMVDAPGYYITTSGKRTHAKNVKGLGWFFNTDGFSFGEDGLTEDCFLKCNDDAIKLYHSGNKIYRTTIWQMENGAPFQISWNMNSNNNGFTVKDCDIIHCDHQWDNPNEAVFDAIHGGSGHMSNYLFENIRIENADWKLVSLQIAKNRFAKAATLGQISNIVFRNITVTTSDGQPMRRLSVINGFDSVSKISKVLFFNVSVNGVYLKNADQAGIEINPNTVTDVQFIVTKPGKASKVFTKKSQDISWVNPIRNGLGSYGQKDFHILYEGSKYYLVATEYTNTSWPKRGIMLYSSADMLNWQEEKILIRRDTVADNAWYKDVWTAPEIIKIANRFYLGFNNRNDLLRPYKKLGFGIAVADKITGPYKILNTSGPLFEGNNASLFAEAGRLFIYYDLDGSFYHTELDLVTGKLKLKPEEMLGREQLKEKYQYLDAPFVFKDKDHYFLLFSQFYAGYIERVRYMVADAPSGPWRFVEDKPLYTFLEAEADELLKMPYPHLNAFAPPTQVVFSSQIFKGQQQQLFIAYHSSEKYAEPYLCIEPVKINADKIFIPAAKEKIQHVK